MKLAKIAALSVSALVWTSTAGGEPSGSSNCSIQCMRATAERPLRPGDPEPSYVVDARKRISTNIENDSAKASMDFILKRFEAEQKYEDKLARANKIIYRTVQFGLAAVSDVAPAIPTAMLGVALDNHYDILQERTAANEDEIAERVVLGGLQKLRELDREKFDNLRNPNQQAIIDALTDPRILGTRNAATDRAIKSVSIQIVADWVKDMDAQQTVNLQSAVTRLEDFDREIAQKVARQQEQLKELRDGQAHLNKAVDLLTDAVGNNTYRLNQVEAVLWGKMDPRERADALKGGAFRSVVNGMSPEKKKEFFDHVNTYAKLHDVTSTIGTVAGIANDIAALPGIGNSPEVRKVADIANKAMAIGQAALAIYTMNPVAILSSAASLSRMFGGGGQDATSAQLAAIQKSINALRSEVRQYHIETMESLARISQQMDAGFRRTWENQSLTLAQVEFNTSLIVSLIASDFSQCSDFISRWNSDDAGDSFDERAAYVNGFPYGDYSQCRQGLLRIFPVAGASIYKPSEVFSVFALVAGNADSVLIREGGSTSSGVPSVGDTPQEIGSIRKYVREVYEPTLRYTKFALGRAYPKCRMDYAGFVAAVADGGTVGRNRAALESVAADCGTTKEAKYAVYTGGNMEAVNGERLLPQLLSPTAVLRHGTTAANYAPYFEMIRNTGEPVVLRREQLIAGQGPGQAATVDALRRVNDVLSITIAQQNIMIGDMVLEEIARSFEWAAQQDPNTLRNAAADNTTCDLPPTSELNAYLNAVCVVEKNPILAANFTTHWVRSRLVKPDYAVSLYPGALQGFSLEYMKPLFTKPLPIRYQAESFGAPQLGGRWVLFYNGPGGEKLLPMPDWSFTASSRLADTGPSYLKLLALRAAINDLLAEYRVSNSLNAEQLSQVRDTYLVIGGALGASE